MTRPLRVLAFPKSGENPFLSGFSGMLEAGGAIVEEFSFRRAFLRRYEVFHIHWPDSHLRTTRWWRAVFKHGRLALLFLLLRARGTRIVWMMHNLQPHEQDHWLSVKFFALWFPRLCTQVMALSACGLEAARRMYPVLSNKPALVVPHGHYRHAYPVPASRKQGRAALALPDRDFIFLFFGNIRPYKNVPQLIAAFRGLHGSHLKLVIAGQPALGIAAQELIEQAQGDERIRLHLNFIADADVPLFLAAADVVVLPFDSILNSGSVLLALSLNRRVLAPRLGALPEIQSRVGPRWLQLYDGELSADLLAQSIGQRSLEADEQPDLAGFEWALIAERTLDFYRSHKAGIRHETQTCR